MKNVADARRFPASGILFGACNSQSGMHWQLPTHFGRVRSHWICTREAGVTRPNRTTFNDFWNIVLETISVAKVKEGQRTATSQISFANLFHLKGHLLINSSLWHYLIWNVWCNIPPKKHLTTWQPPSWKFMKFELSRKEPEVNKRTSFWNICFQGETES